MDLTLDDDQRLLAETARRFVDRQGDPAFTPAVWSQMTDLGWTDLAAHGPMLDVAVLCEALGRGPLSSPLIPSCALAGSDGTSIAAPALDRSDDGTYVLVPFADVADTFVLIDGGELVAVTGEATCTPHHAASIDPLFAVRFGAVERTPLRRSAGAALDRAAVASLAYAVGAAERALEMTIEHACGREQFGRPVGSFQAVAHRCADMKADIDACRYLAYWAAWALDRGGAAGLEVGAAKSYGNEAMRRIFGHAHQVHGAVGFSTEYPLHRFTRVAKTFELTYGGTAAHRRRVAAAMGL